MLKNFDSPLIKNVMNKFLLAFIFYVVTAASFNGLFVINAFMDYHDPRRSFEAMYDETAYKPFIYRQLMMKTAKKIREVLSEETQRNLTQEFKSLDIISRQYSLARIDEKFAIEYHVLYFMCFGCMFVSMFLWRQIGIEVTGSETAGTLAACAFSVLFPMFEWLWVYYDCGEILFFSATVLFACRGNWRAIILISPIAEYNKESFLFFVLTLYPFLTLKMEKKKAAAAVVISAILCGVVYLHTALTYAENIGGNTEWHFWEHLLQFFIIDSWFRDYPFYGVYWGIGFFLPNTLMLAWLAKCTWKKLTPVWQQHIKFALIINVPLFVLFCQPNELRNFSLLYVGFIAMLSIFIKEAIYIEQKNKT